MDIINIIKSLHPLERKILPYLGKAIDFNGLVKISGLKDVEVMRSLQWLSNRGALKINESEEERIMLGKNGEQYKLKGLPERRFLNAIKGRTNIAEIIDKTGLDPNEINICLGALKSKAAIDIKREDGMVITITEQGKRLLTKETLEEAFLKKDFPLSPKELKDEERFAFENLRKRRDIVLLSKLKIKTIELTELGKKLAHTKIEHKEVIDKLTSSVIKSGSWKHQDFRLYDVSINVPNVYGGKRHFQSQAVDYIKKIWLEMGFKEMTGTLVQTSFWDLDSLFVPQDHPARQMQDTFFIKDPKYGKLPPLAKKIKEIHENGSDTGSIGWGGKWSEEIAKENLLRTHTTVLSAQTIAKLKETDLPAKFFSVGKVFRNEALDYKHLFEFYQVEGIVVDPNANLKNLKGYLREFFTKMGYLDVRLRPSHYPYTEPSMDVEVLHPVHKEWIELGGSGIFRPEVTKPLLGFECPVLAWGLGMARIISEYWNISDIRDLDKNDLKQLREMKFWMR
jgi:phenylalanyl-tRNA synthetase alpha chain